MKSKWAEHKGKRILYIDLSNFYGNVPAIEKELTEAVTIIGQDVYTQPLHSVLVLVDLTNTAMTQTTQKLVTERIKDTKEYIAKTAVIGMTGIRKIFLDFFSRLAGDAATGSFENPEAGLEWLVK
jgi:hypothetical protein